MVDPELVDILTTFRDEMVSFMNEMRSEMTSFRNEVNERFNMVEDKLNRVNDTCTLIQYEHGKKLEAIFDYIKEDIEKHQHYKNHSNQVDAKLEDHSIRLSIIESTGAYKSALELMRQENLGKAT